MFISIKTSDDICVSQVELSYPAAAWPQPRPRPPGWFTPLEGRMFVTSSCCGCASKRLRFHLISTCSYTCPCIRQILRSYRLSGCPSRSSEHIDRSRSASCTPALRSVHGCGSLGSVPCRCSSAYDTASFTVVKLRESRIGCDQLLMLVGRRSTWLAPWATLSAIPPPTKSSWFREAKSTRKSS